MPEFISAQATLKSLQFLALTETWISPDNTATPAALSTAHTFTHTPRPSGRTGGGTGILTSPKWNVRSINLSHLSLSTFECHAISITQPVPLIIIVLYRPAGSRCDLYVLECVLRAAFIFIGPRACPIRAREGGVV